MLSGEGLEVLVLRRYCGTKTPKELEVRRVGQMAAGSGYLDSSVDVPVLESCVASY